MAQVPSPEGPRPSCLTRAVPKNTCPSSSNTFRVTFPGSPASDRPSRPSRGQTLCSSVFPQLVIQGSAQTLPPQRPSLTTSALPMPGCPSRRPVSLGAHSPNKHLKLLTHLFHFSDLSLSSVSLRRPKLGFSVLSGCHGSMFKREKRNG